MKAQTLTPAEIFGHHIRYVVPLFQRPYVWNREDQWQPLWDDVCEVAKRLAEAPTGYGAPQVPPHFLGAIVLDQPLTSTGYITVRHVIDGQQRLTTLQLMLDAAQWVAERYGRAMDADALRVLVRNGSVAQQPHEVFKVWPTDRDQDAFQAAMDNDTAVPPELVSSAIARAHAFFVAEIEKWAEVTGDPEKAAARLTTLAQVLHLYLKLVVIDLEPGDNAQVIFETLNHRGAPLLAADLIKNLIFQVALAQQRDVSKLYQAYWRDLDSDYWRQRVARGRQLVPRIDIFVNYWLVMRTRDEVPADQIFVTFRNHLKSQQQPDVESLLAELSRDADRFAQLGSYPEDSAVGRFRYRVIQAMDSAAVTPILLWLLRWQAAELPEAQRDKALGAIESWLVRRAVCRLTSKGINKLVVDLLRHLEDAGPATAGDATETFLMKQDADSRFWPTDVQVVQSLRMTTVYKSLLRARLRMLLEAIEEEIRTDKSEEAICPRNLTVEHVMPRAWREHWGAGVDAGAAAERDLLVHTLGNLTLVNGKLNPALSNRPWTDDEAKARGLGSTGKRTELFKHSTLKLNSELTAANPDTWDEKRIRNRTTVLAGLIVKIWPAPHGTSADVRSLTAAEHEPEPVTEEPSAATESGEHVSKYRPFTEWLGEQTNEFLPMSFQDVEDVLGFSLAPSARNHRGYWYSDDNSFGKAVATAGFKATGVDLTVEKVIFVRR